MSSVANPVQVPKRDPHAFLPGKKSPGKKRNRAPTPRWHVLGPALLDIVLIVASGLIAFHLRFSDRTLSLGLTSPSRVFPLSQNPAGVYLGLLLIYATLFVLIAYSQRLYVFDSSRSPLTESLALAQAMAIATVILTAFIYLSGIKIVSRLVVGLAAVLSLFLLISWRLWRWLKLRRRLVKGIGLRHAIIVGGGKMGTLLADYLQANPTLGYDVRGFLDANHHGAPRVLGKLSDLARVARQEFVDEIFITIPSERELVKQMALEAMKLNLDVKVVPEMYDGLAWQCPLDFVGEFPVRVLHREPIPALGLFLKRVTDVVASALALLLLSPVLLCIAITIVIDSPGPVFYRAYRTGKKGRKFLCYKFRTMIPEADIIKKNFKHLNEREGPFFKISNDPRITRIGNFLRRYSLDELPQLWNVLLGEMSLVGPRPHPLDEFENYTLDHFRRLDVTPGITCLWQTEARQDPSFEKVMALDSKYIENWSYLLDLKILFRTIPVLLKGTGS